jgi:orotate phosphoribosyltransferase
MMLADVLSTGACRIRAPEALREEGHEVWGVRAICDRLAGPGGEAIPRPPRAVHGAEHDRRGLPQRPDRR